MHANSLKYVVGLLLGCAGGQVWAGEECWLEIYDQNGFEGNKVRIVGPAELPSLASLNGENWGNRIDSLAVGPKAQVWAFRQENFRDDASALAYHGDAIRNWGEDARSFSDRAISFGAGRREHHLGELNFHRNINSLKIGCLR